MGGAFLNYFRVFEIFKFKNAKIKISIFQNERTETRKVTNPVLSGSRKTKMIFVSRKNVLIIVKFWF